MTDRFERLIDLGMNQDEAAILTTPLADLKLDMMPALFSAYDRRNKLVQEANKTYVPKNNGIHYVISDGMNAIMNPMNGKVYDSRSAYYQSVKDAGGIIVGNEKMKKRETTSIDKKALRSGLKQAAEKLGF